MIRLLLAMLAWLPGAALAEALAVRSGAHDGFTRLFLELPAGSDWQLGRSEDGYELRVPGADGYDTSAVYARIDRSRLDGLEADGDRLRLGVACQCHATAFRWQESGLVIDIRDGAPPANAAFEAPLISAAPPTPELNLPVVTRSEPAATEAGIQFHAGPPPNSAASPSVGAMEMELLRLLSQAASQGLIEPAPAMPSGDGTAGAEVREPTRDPEPNPEEPVQPLAGLTAHTALANSGPARIQTTEGPSACLPASHFELAPAMDFNADKAAATTGLTGEFDRMEPESVVHLAKTYLSYGFGAEAARALGLDGENTQERLVLLAMSAMVDGLPAQNTILSGQTECEGDGGLWSFLSGDALSSQNAGDRILNSFLNLPNPVAASLAPQLIARLLAVGETERADLVSAMLDGRPQGNSSESRISEVQMAQSRGETGAALDGLVALANSDPRLTPQGLAQLFDLTISEDQRIRPEDLRLAESLRYEHRDDPDIAILATAETRARAYAQDYVGAFDLIGAGAAGLNDTQAQALRDEVAERLANEGSVADVMEIAFDRLPVLGDRAQNLLAERLLDLGFADRAAELLSGPATAEHMSDRRYLRAAAALAMGRPDDVTLILHGMTGVRSDALRAAAEMEALGGAAMAPASDHAQVAGISPLAVATLAELSPKPLMASRSLLDDARSLRTSIEQTLLATALTDPFAE